MAQVSVPIISGLDVTTALQTAYTVPSSVERAVLTAVTFCNYTSVPSWVTVRIVPPGATSDILHELIHRVTIRGNSSYAAPELIGHAINAGGKIEVVAENPSSISMHATATLI